MIISLLIYAQIIYTIAEVYNGSIFNSTEQNSLQHIWHSYTFNTGAGNREELHFSNAGLKNDFDVIDRVFTWKSLQFQEQIVVIGLGDEFLIVTSLSNDNNSATYKEEIQNSAKALAVFQKWDVKTQQMQSFAIVATYKTEKNFILKWYQILDRKLKFLWDWPFHENISYLDVIKIDYESKLLIVSTKGSIYKTSSAEIYSFSMNQELDVWLFEKITMDAAPSSVAIFDNTNNIFFCAAIPSLEMIHVFIYSKSLCMDTLEKKHFISHQKIFSIGLKSLISFRVGFRWYLAVASKLSLMYYLKENLLFQPIDNLVLGSFNNWLAIPVDTYREDVILLADSDSDISVLTWIGDNHIKILGSFTEFACGNDSDCCKKMERVALKESTAFGYNGLQNIIISTKNSKPLFFKLFVKLKPLPDKVTSKLQDILDMKILLEENYINQNEKINQLLYETDSIPEVESTVFSAEIFNNSQVSEAVSHTKNWSEIMFDVNKLKTTIESLDSDIKKYLRKLKSDITPQNEEKPNKFLIKNLTDGITFYGDVLINELNLSSINGYDVRKLLTDSFRKDKVNKIGGKKIIKNLNAENVIFEKMKNTLACDVIFSDDLMEENRNIINGDVIWENNVNILNDVMILPESAKQNISSEKSRRTPKNVYDTLNFEELEVTEDVYIQKTINGQPFILPVHSGQLSVLDVVNQARIEVVNVKEDLDVSFINGKNFSHFLEHLLFKPPIQQQFDSIKVDGVFSAPDIHFKQLNSIDLSRGESDFQSDMFNQNIFENQPKSYTKEKNLKKAQYQNMKRTVHVFQNLEVDGILFSNKINNISWVVLNDTVKKDEKSVVLTGVKKFKKLEVSKNINLSGTLNGRFPDHVLNNFSNQFISFPQLFDKVEFRNLSLEGAWNGVFVNELNNSIVRMPSKNSQISNLTFEDKCFVNVLNVTDFVNNINLKEKGSNRKTDDRIELKTINATNVILHGSLITNDKINNLNFSNFSKFRVSLKSPEIVKHNLFHQNLTISGDLNLETFNFNDLASIINSGGDTNFIEKFLNGEVHSVKKLLVKGNISTSHGINGYNTLKIFEKGVRITKPSSIKGNITFENIVYFDNINVTGSVDGFSLRTLEKDIAFRNSHIFLSGPKNFSVFKVTKKIKTKTLNGHLVQDIVSLKGDQIMKGPVQINGNVIVRGNITTYAAINDIIVPDLLKTYSTKVNSFLYSGDLTLKSDQITIQNLIIDGNIQNVSLEVLINDAVLKNENFSFSGKKSFKGEVKFKGNVIVEDYIHGVNFSKFYSDIAFVNKPAKFEGTVVVEEAVLKVLETMGYFNSNLINNFDSNDWLEDSIPLNRYGIINEKKKFEEIYVLQDISANFINGHLPSAMISLKKKQHIPSLALFPSIHTTSDLSVSGFVNGKILNKEFQDTVLVNGIQTIKGKTLFNNDFIVNGSLFVDTIKEKSINNLITLNTEQIIKTPLEFTGSVKAKKGVENLKIINNIDLHEWNQNSVSLNRNQTLNGSWTIKGRVKTKNISGHGLLHTVSLPDLSKTLQKDRLMALELKNVTEVEFSNQCHEFEEFSKQFSKLPYLFYRFDITDEIETSSVIDSVITFRINDENHLIITFLNECLSTLYKWNKDSGIFVYLRQLNVGPVSKWSILYRNNATYLVTSSLRSSTTCEENLQQGNIWIFKNNSEKYAHLLSTNAFFDITHENSTSDEFFTIDANGTLQQWIIQENGNVSSKFLLSVGPGNYRFLDFRIMGGLAISNGREIKQITITSDKVIENNISFTNIHIVALPIEGKTLIAVTVKDKIVIYENILEDKIFSIIHTYRAGSVLWFNFGLEKQAFLIVASHHRLIEVYEYKSVSGLIRKMSIQMFSTRLQSETLAVREKYQPLKFVIVIQKKKLIFIRADMLGDSFKRNDSVC